MKFTEDIDIPRPDLTHWMHQRIPMKYESIDQKQRRWAMQRSGAQALDHVLSTILVKWGLGSKKNQPTFNKFLNKGFLIYFKIFHRLKVYGLNNIPKEGAIFYVNHPGTFDPMLIWATCPYRVGALMAWSQGWLMEMVEKIMGQIMFRGWENRADKVERMINHLLTKNRYLAIWPSGHPHHHETVEQGHSSISRVYAVLNSDKNRIPFVPVYLRGAGGYANPPKVHTSPIEVHYFEPIYLDREWLNPLEQGGKTPREIIDYLMIHLASKRNQKYLVKNELLERRRQGHIQRAKSKMTEHKDHKNSKQSLVSK